MIVFHVPGKPIPQGSKRWLPEGRMIEANKDLRPWRATVTAYTIKAMREYGAQWPLAGPLDVSMTFTFTRPKSHYGTGRNAGKVKPNAPRFHDRTPDIDKIVRSVNDGITDAGLWKDDDQVAFLTAVKLYGEQAGVTVRITEKETS